MTDIQRSIAKIAAEIMILAAAVILIWLICRHDPGAEFRGYNRFQTVEKYDDCTVYVDTETGVAYVKYRNLSLSPLYDVDEEFAEWLCQQVWDDYGRDPLLSAIRFNHIRNFLKMEVEHETD